MLVQLLPSEAYPDPTRRVVHASRATGQGAEARAGEARSDGRRHTIVIAFDRISIAISVTRPPVSDLPGVADPLVVTRASRPVQGNGRPADDTVHGNTVQVCVTSALLCDYLDRLQGEASPGDVLIVDPRLVRDPSIERLAHALGAADEVEQGLGALYADAVCLAIVTRLLGMRCVLDAPAANRRKTALPKWRLKRVVEYVEAHLDGPITLADLAAAAGLTRMHFAAQFKVATGVRPHEYVLRRRVERAQELLRSSSLTLVEVALSVGFQTQAHFTTVFRRFADATPHRWRRAASDAVGAAQLS